VGSAVLARQSFYGGDVDGGGQEHVVRSTAAADEYSGVVRAGMIWPRLGSDGS
jgi:hypothetical protein